ncbi:MAG: glycoside hydrolase family 127 protein [Bacteroidota bacterium]|nr:glycoside hydrolase family 127 protein [Bacteroidota bacterium]
MKYLKQVALIWIASILFACGNDAYRLTVINSGPFAEKQITIDNSVMQQLLTDSLLVDQGLNVQESNTLSQKTEEMISLVNTVRETKSDSLWKTLSASWEDFRRNHVGPDGLPVVKADSLTDSQSKSIARKWAELNVNLLKLSGEVKFGDALEKMLYGSKVPVLSEKFLKSVIYTHIDDQIFINVIGSSSVNHHHTTGGTIKLIQKTDYPKSNEMILKCECDDVRYLDLFIRIPAWAVNPTVTHGNVKYVPHPGEYCQISRKWNDGDEIQVRLKN